MLARQVLWLVKGPAPSQLLTHYPDALCDVLTGNSGTRFWSAPSFRHAQ